MFVNSDFTDLLRLFNDNNVKYLVIGGYAIIQYAESRFTKDLDFWISTDTTNAAAVYKALKKVRRTPCGSDRGRLCRRWIFLSNGGSANPRGSYDGHPREKPASPAIWRVLSTQIISQGC